MPLHCTRCVGQPYLDCTRDATPTLPLHAPACVFVSQACLDKKDEDELSDMEDDFADDRFMEEYRCVRMHWRVCRVVTCLVGGWTVQMLVQ